MPAVIVQFRSLLLKPNSILLNNIGKNFLTRTVHVYMYINHYRATFVVGTCGMVIWNLS